MPTYEGDAALPDDPAGQQVEVILLIPHHHSVPSVVSPLAPDNTIQADSQLRTIFLSELFFIIDEAVCGVYCACTERRGVRAQFCRIFIRWRQEVRGDRGRGMREERATARPPSQQCSQLFCTQQSLWGCGQSPYRGAWSHHHTYLLRLGVAWTAHLATTSIPSHNRSTSLPFPSSPHWAPNTTVTPVSAMLLLNTDWTGARAGQHSSGGHAGGNRKGETENAVTVQ